MKQIFTPLILGLLLSSCAYEPDGWYDAPVQPADEAPAVQVVELDLEADTVFVYGSRTVHFTFDAGRSDVLMVKLLVDGQVVDSLNEGAGSLEFSGYVEQPAIRELELQILVTSGTGSIADKLQAEGYLLSQKWVMVQDRYIAGQLRDSVDQGRLLLQWDSYRSADFDSYEIVRGSYTYKTLGETKNRSFYIDTYVGEGAEFTVNVITKKGQRRTWGKLSLLHQLPVPRMVASGEEGYVISWSPVKYYHAFAGYQLTVNYNTTYNYTSVNDTMVAIQAVFGDMYQVSLQVKPIAGNTEFISNPYSFSKSVSVTAGTKIEIGHPAWLLKQINASELACNDGQYLYVFSPEQGRVVRSIPIRNDSQNAYGQFSPLCRFYLGYTNNEAPFNPQYFVSDLQTGVVVPQAGYKALVYNSSGYTAIADNGRGIVVGSTYEAGFDFTTGSQLYITPRPGSYAGQVYISSDSKYFVTIADSMHLKRFDANKSTRLAAMNAFNLMDRKWLFNPLNSNELVMASDPKLVIYQCEPFKVQQQFGFLPGEILLFVDFYRREALTGMPKKLIIRNLDDWAIRKEIAISTNPSGSSNIVLCNRYVILYGATMKRFTY